MASYVIDWANHYNRRESRCFVEIRYSHDVASIRSGLMPGFSSELYDAVERLRLAAHTSWRLKDDIARDLFCQIPDPMNGRATISADCTASEKYIRDRMTN